MRFLIINTDYPELLRWLYTRHPKLEKEPYEEQIRVRAESLFGVADFYSSNLRRLGHEAWDIHANNQFMQKVWAREHGVEADSDWPWYFHLKKGALPWVSQVLPERKLNRILAAQIRYYKPDVLLNQDMVAIGIEFLREMRPYARLIVGQIASPLPKKAEFGCYDLIMSSLPSFVDYFRRMGVPAELHRFAFEPRIQSSLIDGEEKISVSFVGSFSSHHTARSQLLEHLCAELEIRVWGHGIDSLPKNSPIRRCYMGQAWGIDMYRVLHNSKITVNQHIDVAAAHANNMRLYEATGVGVLLITDWKVDLQEMFEPGKEVVAYRSHEECADLIRYYLEHEDERAAVALAGQQRTLRRHTYYERMQELIDIVRKFL